MANPGMRPNTMMLVMLLISGLYLSIPRNPNATQGLDDYASISKKKNGKWCTFGNQDDL